MSAAALASLNPAVGGFLQFRFLRMLFLLLKPLSPAAQSRIRCDPGQMQRWRRRQAEFIMLIIQSTHKYTCFRSDSFSKVLDQSDILMTPGSVEQKRLAVRCLMYSSALRREVSAKVLDKCDVVTTFGSGVGQASSREQQQSASLCCLSRRDVFAEILDKCDVVTTPGSGFGPAGEGFVRASAFAHR